MDLIEKYNASNAFGRLLGMQFKVLSPGKIEYTITVTKDHLATPLSAHGGLIGAFVDAAMGTAALSAVYLENKVVSTVEYKINFLSPAYTDDELVAHGTVITQGKRILVVKCDVLCSNRQNKMIATALGTFNAYDAEKAKFKI
jgi:acyl-CoA thioesterase